MSTSPPPDRSGKAIVLAEEADFSLGELRVRPSSREVDFRGRLETLEPRVMQVLVALARRQGEVVSRDRLIELCWGGRTVGEDALNRSIARVRRLASPDSFTLETIARVGYRLTAAARPAAESEQVPEEQSPDEPHAPTPPAVSRGRPRVRGIVAIAACLLVAVVALAAWQLSLTSRPYFAVLPFEVVGRAEDIAHLADAIPTAVSNRLTAQGHTVVSPALSFQYRGARKAAAAAELAPRYVVDGSVRVEGGRLRVTARIDVASEPVSIWSEELSFDVGAVHEVPEHVATALASLFNPGVRVAFEQPPEVVAAILRIGSRWRLGDDIGAYVASRELLRRFPDSGTAQIYYSIATGAALELLPENERAAALVEARTAAERAATGTASRGPMAVHALIPPVEWARREHVLRTGLANEHADASGLRRLLSAHLANSGRLTEALTISSEALSVDRLSLSNVATHAGLLDTMGRPLEADVSLAEAARFWPATERVERLRFSSAITRGDLDGAAALLQDPTVGRVIDPQAERRPLRPMVLALRTREPAAIADFERECADPSKLARHQGGFCLAALGLLGRLDTFFEVASLYLPEQRAETAAQRDAHWLRQPQAMSHARVLFREDLRAVREDERFIPLAERAGLLDYWRSTGRWPDFCADEPASVCPRMRSNETGSPPASD